MPGPEFNAGDTVWRKGEFQKLRITSVDRRTGMALVKNANDDGTLILISFGQLTTEDPHLSDTGPLAFPLGRIADERRAQ